MGKKKQEKEIKQYTVRMRETYEMDYTVEATSLEEAKQKAEDSDFIDDGIQQSRLDWEVLSVKEDD